jgi:hypothetical protein
MPRKHRRSRRKMAQAFGFTQTAVLDMSFVPAWCCILARLWSGLKHVEGLMGKFHINSMFYTVYNYLRCSY